MHLSTHYLRRILRAADPDPMADGGGAPATNPALAEAGLPPKQGLSKELPVFDEGDEFAGDDGKGNMPTDDDPEPVAGDDPPPAAKPSDAPPEAAGDLPDAVPGEDAFDKWAEANPAEAEKYLAWQESQAAEAETAAAGDTFAFADPAEQAVNIQIHLQEKGAQYDAGVAAFNADWDTYQKDLKEYEELENEGKETPLAIKFKASLDRARNELDKRRGILTRFNAGLELVEKANKIVDMLPNVFGTHRELFVELYSSGKMAGSTTVEAQKAELNQTLAARGLPLMGQKGGARGLATAKPVSAAVKRYRELRGKTAPNLHTRSARAPESPAGQPKAGAQGGQSGPALHPALAATLERIKGK